MKPFEAMYACATPFMPALHQKVRSSLLVLRSTNGHPPAVLDVGGRKSHYTIGVPGRVTITDLPRESDVQRQLNLGLTPALAEQTLARRSNVERIVFDDMTHSALPDESFDCAIAIEVLEHVENDLSFIAEVWRVLRPGGLFLLTTPNGDVVVNHNPDHKRHYRRDDLRSLLAQRFAEADVTYEILGGTLYSLGLRSWSVRRPVRTAVTMMAAFLNHVQSKSMASPASAQRMQKLFGVAKK